MGSSLLLDTHALIWAVNDPAELGKAARAAIEDGANDIWVSAVSAMEVCTKVRIGKLEEAEELAGNFETIIKNHGFQKMPITVEQAARAGLLPIPHKDSFDRMLIAQAQIEKLTLISNEEKFDQWGIIRLW